VSLSPFINFIWSETPAADIYKIELATDNQFNNIIVIDSTLTEANYQNLDSLPDGIYYWRVSAGNGYGWSEYSEVRNFGVQAETGIIYLVGDVNHSGAVNGLDVIYLVNYFKGGSPPPLEVNGFYPEADANGSCSVNGLDVVYLVAFFKGGDPPIDGNCL
jgi:hypothetical protein